MSGWFRMYSKGGEGVFKAELQVAEVDPRFEICCDAIAVSKKLTLFYFWSDRFETKKTWIQIYGVHVLFVSKYLDQKYKSVSFFDTS